MMINATSDRESFVREAIKGRYDKEMTRKRPSLRVKLSRFKSERWKLSQFIEKLAVR